jgi:D-glycero-alpha-D-manno-heptose-7-phosphate kinase
MILTRSPFRATLGGGGTDLPSYYERHGGFVFSMALDKYMYVAINPPVMDKKIRVHYTKSETVDHPDQLQHELVREALLRQSILEKMEISSMADLRAGTGLGSSSCYLVALLRSLRAFKREPVGLQELAEEACDIEINKLKRPIGKQDQYMAAYGGMTVLDIAKDGLVTVRSAKINNATLMDFIANTHLYYTGIRGSVPEILRDQDSAMRRDTAPAHDVVEGSLHGIKELGYSTLEAIESENYDEFGNLMDKHWQFKKRLSPRISIPGIDELYSEIKSRFGVLGSKVSGAGGGGFFMVYAPKHHAELDEFMTRHGLTRMHYGVDWEGAKILVQ